jgi:APA family basic amino acid/polyamine antiporter
MSDANLESSIGLFEAVSIEVGIVVGAGLFSVTGVAAGIAGPAVALAYLVAFVVVSLSIVPTAVLGALYPTTGGNYRYPSRLWSPRAAFVATWGMAVSVLGGGLPLYGLSFGEYATVLVDVDPRLVGLAVITAFFLVNLAGIEMAARVQQGMLVTLVAAIAVFVGLGAPSVTAANLTPFAPAGVGGVLAGAALLYFVCMGANFIVDLGGELRAATVVIPRSFLVSIPLVAVLYVLTSFVAVGSVGRDTLSGDVLAVAAEAALSPAAATFFTVGGGLFAIATTINAVYMIAPRYLVALAADGAIPAEVGAVNDRFGTPHWALALVYGISAVFLASPFTLQRYSTLMGFGSIVLVLPVLVAAVVLVRDRPDAYREAPVHLRPRRLVAIAVCAVGCNLVLLGVLASQFPGVFAVWLGLVTVGAAYFVARRYYLARRGIDLLGRMSEDIQASDGE